MKKILVSMVIILMLFSIISVKAEELKKLDFTANEYEIEKGEEVVLTISSDELTGIEGILKYDSSVLTITSKNSENSFTLNEEKGSNAFGKFALVNLGAEEEITVKLTFKSKEDTTVDSTVISISEIVGSDKTGGGFDIDEKTVTIKFKKEEPKEPEIPEIPEEPEVPEIPEEPTEKNEDLPETGVENIYMILLVLGIISVIAYLKHKKYNF